jgi:hypothetical protein
MKFHEAHEKCHTTWNTLYEDTRKERLKLVASLSLFSYKIVESCG